MNEEKLERRLQLTKSGKYTVWTTSRSVNNEDRHFGYAETVCASIGKQTRIFRTLVKKNEKRRLVRISPKSVIITAITDKNGTRVTIFKVSKIDEKERVIHLEKVASMQDGKWDNTKYYSSHKEAIHSVSLRSKKYFNKKDLN